MASEQDKRRLIMQAAEELFTTRRFHEITMDDVAALAKVAKGTLYHHFKDKEDLFFQASTSGLEELCELIQRSAGGNETYADQLLHVCREISSFFEKRRQLLRMMQSEDDRHFRATDLWGRRWLQKRRQLVLALAGILARGVDEGQVRRDVPPESLAGMLLGLLRVRARDLGEAAPEMRRFEVVLDMFNNGACGPVRFSPGESA
jgi:AcrR family transcriptional regulator